MKESLANIARPVAVVAATAALMTQGKTELAPEIPVTQPETQVCIEDATSPMFTPADYEQLPPLNPAEYGQPDEQGLINIGTARVEDGKFYLDAPALPDTYEHAITRAATTPYVACGLSNLVGKLQISVATQGEGAFFSTADFNPTADPKRIKAHSQINLYLGEAGPATTHGNLPRLFTTPAAITEALTHEAAHARAYQAGQKASKDPVVDRLLTEFRDSYADNMKTGVESIREDYAPAAIPALESLRDQFEERDLTADAALAQKTIDGFATEHGLDDFVVYDCPFTSEVCGSTILLDGILSSEAHAIKYADNNAPMLNQVMDTYQDLIEGTDVFPATDGSSARPGLFTGGTPYTSWDEMQAEIIGITNTLPVQEVVDKINSLPDEARERTVRSYKILDRLYRHAFPEDRGNMQLDEVVAQL